jgi:hypothetical protein
MITTAIAALGLAGAMAIGAPTTTRAQGVYLEGPGVEFGIGPRYHRYYRDYDRPYVIHRPWVEHRYYRFHHRWHDWD